MNRRDFLRGTLTLAGLGLCGCPRSLAPPDIKGSRRDPSFKQGHRLRNPDFPDQPSSIEKCDGVILGGGIAGLSAGWRWTRAGFEDYVLLELEPEVGGNSRALVYPPSPAPIGAHYLPIPNSEARAVRRLLEEMGVLKEGKLNERDICHSREDRLLYKGSWHEGLVPVDALSEESFEQLEQFNREVEQWAVRRDSQGRKVFALPLQHSSTDPEFLALDKISFAEFAADKGWDDPFLLWYLNYACRDDFGGSIHNCSAWAGLHYFASRDGGGLGDAGDILVWPEGNQRLAGFMRDQQKGRVATGSLIISVAQTSDGVQVDYWDVATSTRKRLECKVAVFCLPSFLRPYLLEKTASVEQFVYSPWLTANIWMDHIPEDLEAPGHIAWDNVIYDSESLGYVVATHQDLATDPLRPTVWTWYRPFPDGYPAEVRESLLKAEWKTWADTVLNELEPYHANIRQVCRQLDVTVLGHGMIRPTTNFVWGSELAAARKPDGRLFFGHGDLSGMSLFEESQYRGVQAAEEALEHLGLREESFL